jgi:hypothetical protein
MGIYLFNRLKKPVAGPSTMVVGGGYGSAFDPPIRTHIGTPRNICKHLKSEDAQHFEQSLVHAIDSFPQTLGPDIIGKTKILGLGPITNLPKTIKLQPKLGAKTRNKEVSCL